MTETKLKKVYLACPYLNLDNAEYRTKELELLTFSAMYEIVKTNLFVVKEINASTYMGIGKVEQIRDEVRELGAEMVIFDCPLTGSQLRNLSELIDVECIDRTMLILEIFSSRAKSGEGKLQVELAKLKYSLPRLTAINMNNARNNISGESLGELNKRKIQEDINRLEREIKEINKHRQTTRKQRLSRMQSVALVGYTNSGKSTLMNAITKAGTYADDRLFATLDVLTKKVWDDGVEYVLIDTVGFVSDLPHELVYAFSSTLEETLDANVIVMVVDASDPHKYDQISVVEKELNRLSIDPNHVILVYNKVDKISSAELQELKSYPYDTCYIEAKGGKNIIQLKQMIKQKLDSFKY